MESGESFISYMQLLVLARACLDTGRTVLSSIIFMLFDPESSEDYCKSCLR